MNESKPNSWTYAQAVGWWEGMTSYQGWVSCILYDPNELESMVAAMIAEVERLRAEVQRLDIAGTHTCHDDCPKLPCVQRREIERLRDELAAAKAASVCPVQVLNIYDTEYPSDCYIECRTGDDCEKFRDWLRDRIQDQTTPAA